MKRRLICLLLSVTMLISLIVTPAEADTETTYASMSSTWDSAASAIICKASDLGIWELRANASDPSSGLEWQKSGFNTFLDYVADLVAKANANGSQQLSIEGFSSPPLAGDPVYLWLTTNLRIIICSHPATAAIGEGKEPVPCQTAGVTPGLKCTVCNGIIYPQQVIPFSHKKTVTVDGKAATCTSPGFTTGEVCSNCSTTISVQGQTIEAIGHSWTEDEICRNCGRTRAAGVEIPTYLITVKDTGETTTTADAHYACAGTLVTLKPQVDEGVHIVAITVTDTNGEELSVTALDNGTYTFTMMESSVTAVVKSGLPYNISLGGDMQNGTVSVTSNKAYTGEIITINAVPEDGFSVDSITVTTQNGPVAVNCTGKNTYAFEMPNADVSISAAFVKPQGEPIYQVITEPTTHGAVTANVMSGKSGAPISVSIAPESGYRVESISVINKTTGEQIANTATSSTLINFKMPSSDVSVKVTFTPAIYSIIKGEVLYGSVTINPQTAQEGAEVTICATPDDGYMVGSFYASDAVGKQFASTGDLELTFTMPDHDVIINAIFEPLPPEYAVLIANSEHGTVETSYEDARMGSGISFFPVPDEGFEVDRVSVVLASNPSITVPFTSPSSEPDSDYLYHFDMPDEDVIIDVAFKAILYDISVGESENGTIQTFNNIRAAVSGQGVKVIAAANNGYEAEALIGYVYSESSIDEDGNIISGSIRAEQLGVFEDNECIFTMPSGHVILHGVFKELPPEYTIRVATAGKGTVAVIPDTGVSVAGGQITVFATPDDNYSLDEITVSTVDGVTEIISSEISPCSFVMPECDVMVDVQFKKIPEEHRLVLAKPTMGGGTVAANYADKRVGSIINITATPDSGYEVGTVKVYETESGTEIGISTEDSTSRQFSFIMPDCDATVAVTFKASKHGLSVGNGVKLNIYNAAKGESIIVTATPGTSQTVKCLTVTPEDSSVNVSVYPIGENQWTFTMPACAVTVTAEYEDNPIEHQVSILKSSNGTLNVDKATCEAGTLVTITASPAEGYALDELYFRSIGSSTPVQLTKVNADTYTFIMPESNVEIRGTFVAAHYRINLTASGNGVVSVNQSSAAMGQTITILTTPNEGNEILDVTVTTANGDPVEAKRTGDQFTFTMPASSVNISARFKSTAPTLHKITGSAVNGTVRISPASAKAGATVTVNTSPNAGYIFESLTVRSASGLVVTPDISDTGNHTFVMPDEPVTVTGTFKRNTYDITLNSSVNGKLFVLASAVEPNTSVTIIATPNVGYTTRSVTVMDAGGKTIEVTVNPDNGNQFSFIMPEKAVFVSAEFAAVPRYTITVTGIGNGSIQPIDASFVKGTKVTIVPKPANGHQVESVTVQATANSSTIETAYEDGGYSFAMPASNVTVTVKFVEIVIPTYKINSNIKGNGTLSFGASAAKAGVTVTVSALPKYGYELTSLTVTGTRGKIETRLSNGRYSFTMPEGDVTVNAEFIAIEEPSFSITVPGSDYGSIEVNSTSVKAGETVTLTVMAKPGYRVDAVQVITVNSSVITVTKQGSGIYTFVMPDQDVVVKPMFKVIEHSIAISSSDHGSIELSAQTAESGATVTITGIPATGYALTGVTITAENGISIPAIRNTATGMYSFVMPDQAVSVRGIFTAKPDTETKRKIHIADVTGGVVSVEPTSAKANETVTVSSRASAGYEFESMTITRDDTGARVTATALGNGTFSFRMPSCDVTLTTTFRAITYAVNTTTNTYGTVRVDKPRASVGEKITIVPVPNSGYETDSLSVKTPEGREVATVPQENGTFTFDMPASSVTVSAAFQKAAVAPDSYSITISAVKNGSVKAVYNNSTEGSTITLQTLPDSGYELESINVTSRAGKRITVKAGTMSNSYTFVMPTADVVVDTTFRKSSNTQTPEASHKIKVVSSVHGVTTLSKTSAAAGASISITAKPDDNYIVDTVIVKEASGQSITIARESDTVYTFVMPAAEVEVTATYKQGAASTAAYNVKVMSAANGVVTATPANAQGGAKITLNVVSYNGYQLDSLQVTDSRGVAVSTSVLLNGDYTFTMPASDVTVTPSFNYISAPSVPAMTRKVKRTVSGMGTIEVSCEEATPGTTITITAKPESGHYLGIMRVEDSGGRSIALTKNAAGEFQFVLPASNVTVYASFYAVSSNSSSPIMPGTNVMPNEPNASSEPANPGLPTLPDSPFDPINSYQLPFSDMGLNSWFYSDVLYLYQRGIIRGVSETSYGPHLTTTRGDVAVMLYRLAGEPRVDGKSQFDDVEPLTYYADAVSWAAANGYVNGVTKSIFSPSALVSREQLVTILYRYACAHNADIDISNTAVFRGFDDASAVSSYAVNAMVWACNAGIINGDSSNMLKPASSATRAEISAIVHRFCLLNTVTS